MQNVEVRDTVTHPMVHRTAPHSNNYLMPNVKSTVVEKCCEGDLFGISIHSTNNIHTLVGDDALL